MTARPGCPTKSLTRFATLRWRLAKARRASPRADRPTAPPGGDPRAPDQRPPPQRPGQRPNQFNTTLAELTAGQPVVHLDFGIGRYQGIERRRIDGSSTTSSRSTFAATTRSLFLSRASGSLDPMTEAAPRPSISSEAAPGPSAVRGFAKACSRSPTGWSRRRQSETPLRSESRSSTRVSLPGSSRRCSPSTHSRPGGRFWRDRQGPREAALMDRLVCGDVGFGKTEVAMRAAFAAVAAGQQVAVLVLTTVLCQQHVRSFSERFGAVERGRQLEPPTPPPRPKRR